jgi:tetratricopeptide (TPR) repeat protein
VRARARALALALLLASGVARAQEPGTRPPVADARGEAELSFEQANALFHRGEYRAAIPLFRRAFELSGEPALIFNVAQSHRMAGDCRPAIAAYQHFLGLSGDASLRATAQAHIDHLQGACPAVGPPIADVQVARPAPASRPARAWPKVGLTSMGAGLLAGVGAGALYLSNGARYRRWQDEDRQLRLREVSPAEGLIRQRDNDELWRSIRRTDRVSLGLGIAGGILVVGGAMIWLISRPGDRSLSLAVADASLGGRVRW